MRGMAYFKKAQYHLAVADFSLLVSLNRYELIAIGLRVVLQTDIFVIVKPPSHVVVIVLVCHPHHPHHYYYDGDP